MVDKWSDASDDLINTFPPELKMIPTDPVKYACQ